jgi:hypothetical protein
VGIQRPAPVPPVRRVRKSMVLEAHHNMDAERINLIGTTLADLQSRAADLRRYL